MKKKSFLFVLIIVIISGVIYFQDHSSDFETKPAYSFLSQQKYRYQLTLQQQTQSEGQLLDLNATSLELNATLSFVALDSNAIEMIVEDVRSDSILSVMKNDFSLKETLSNKSCIFYIDSLGEIAEISFKENEQSTIKEILKSIVSLMQWKEIPNSTDSVFRERLASNTVKVHYRPIEQNSIIKEIIDYTDLSSFALNSGTFHKSVSGEQELTLENKIPTDINGASTISLHSGNQRVHQFNLNYELKLQETKALATNKKNWSNKTESLATISENKISREQSLRALAGKLTTQKVSNLILTKSNPKDWFHRAVAQIMLDPNSHIVLEKLYRQTQDSEQRILILDLLVSAGDKRFQQSLISILKTSSSDPNYAQMVQRLSLLNSPSDQALNFISNGVKNLKLQSDTTPNDSETATLYTYGAMARQLDDKSNQEIFDQLSSYLEQSDNDQQTDALLLAIANTGNIGTVDTAKQYLDSPSEKVREASVITLGSINLPDSKDLLLDKLEDQSTKVVIQALKELAKFWLTEDDYTTMIKNIGTPSERELGFILAIAENRATTELKPLIPFLLDLHNNGAYSESSKRRIRMIIEMYNRL